MYSDKGNKQIFKLRLIMLIYYCHPAITVLLHYFLLLFICILCAAYA